MVGRVVVVVAALLALGLDIAPATAQPAYGGYGSEAPPPYFDGVPYGRRGARIVYDQDGNALVVNRRGRVIGYLDDNDVPGYARGRARIIPGDPDEANAAPQPYFTAPGNSRAAPNGAIMAPERQAGLPLVMQPPVSSQDDAQPPSVTPGDTAQPNADAQLPPQFRKQVVTYTGKESPGTIIVDTRHTYLYLVLGHGQAIRYGIGVGREGFTWSGREKISRMAEWPDWYPPEEMIQRQPYLPRMMAGGPGNPLGARALYLGNTLYRIHGTNDPTTIGKYVSSGCIRLTNQDVEDLYQRVHVGTKVLVLPGGNPHVTASARR
jgi:lipoprotein-anchoring transpeptidase ErfK/SrfK